jgi:O-acetyl-ADP-ribose deacetylase
MIAGDLLIYQLRVRDHTCEEYPITVYQGALTDLWRHARITLGTTMNTIISEHTFPSGYCLQLVQGDLTEERVDAIVNAANAYLKHGGGVAGVIARKGGPTIQLESDQWVQEHGPVLHPEPAFTSAGNLPCHYVLHAVGPVWGEGDEDLKLCQAVTGSLKLADRLGLSSLAFPAISTGIYGFPKQRAAGNIYRAICEYFHNYPQSGVGLVRLTLFDDATIAAFVAEWKAQGLGKED